MANSLSAKQRVVRNNARAVINKNRRSRVRTFVKRVENAIADQNAEQAETALRAAQPELQRSVAKGIFKAGTVSRKISRLSARIKDLKNASGAAKK